MDVDFVGVTDERKNFDGFCNLQTNAIWDGLLKARVGLNKTLAERIIAEIIAPEVLQERPAFVNEIPPPLPAVGIESACPWGGSPSSVEQHEVVVDTIMFGIDNDMLEVRILELYDVVDWFIIMESGYTHSGLKKPFLYRKEQFKVRFFSASM